MKLKQIKNKLKKTHKALLTFLITTNKNYVSMKNKINKIWALVLLAIIICSCGTTKVKVNRPDRGTLTTITVTTNNPITTNTDADATADLKLKGE